MRVIEKKVYYCEFCKKHGLSGYAMKRHESRCTGNINRECHWDWNYKTDTGHDSAALPEVLANFGKSAEPDDILLDQLREAVGSCPACMLTVLKQTSREWLQHFDYATEVSNFNKMQFDLEEEETRREIEASWL